VASGAPRAPDRSLEWKSRLFPFTLTAGKSYAESEAL
jgi:hypothetical protein